MKSINLFLLIILVISVFSCQNKTNENATGKEENTPILNNEISDECPPVIIGKLNNNIPEFTGNVVKMRNALENEWMNLLKITAQADSVYIKYNTTSSISYVIIEGKTNSGTSLKTAIELKFNSGEFQFLCDGETHTCTSEKCPDCQFVWKASEKITGCDCNTDKGICNHTIKNSSNDVYQAFTSK